LDHDQPTLPTLAGSSNNQEQPGSDLSMRNALHCVSLSYASAVIKHKKNKHVDVQPHFQHMTIKKIRYHKSNTNKERTLPVAQHYRVPHMSCACLCS